MWKVCDPLAREAGMARRGWRAPAVTSRVGVRLGRYFGTSAQFWLNLPTRYDLEDERDRLGLRPGVEVAVFSAAS